MTDLITMAANTIATWAALSGYLNRLYQGRIMGRWQQTTHLHYAGFVWCGYNPINPTLCDTGAAVVGVSVAEHARGVIAERVSRRAKCFQNTFTDTFGSDW